VIIPAVKPKSPVPKNEVVEGAEQPEEEDEMKEGTDDEDEDIENSKNRIEEKVIRMSKCPRVFYVGSDSCTSTSAGGNLGNYDEKGSLK
jgi:hypothetical protein